MGELSTAHFRCSPPNGRSRGVACFHVDADASVPGANYHVTRGIVAEARVFLSALHDALGARVRVAAADTATLAAEVRAAHALLYRMQRAEAELVRAQEGGPALARVPPCALYPALQVRPIASLRVVCAALASTGIPHSFSRAHARAHSSLITLSSYECMMNRATSDLRSPSPPPPHDYFDIARPSRGHRVRQRFWERHCHVRRASPPAPPAVHHVAVRLQ